MGINSTCSLGIILGSELWGGTDVGNRVAGVFHTLARTGFETMVNLWLCVQAANPGMTMMWEGREVTVSSRMGNKGTEDA